jgi:hypothetical protein
LKTAAIMPYGADTLLNGSLCGPETMERLDWTVMVVLAHPDTKFSIFLGAGYNPDHTGYRIPFNKIMAEYLLERFEQADNLDEKKRKPFIMPEIVLAKKDAWGTIAETLAVMEELRERNIHECMVVSSNYHIPRIMIIWNHVGEFKVTHYVAVKHSKVKTTTVLYEPVKLFATLFFPKKFIPEMSPQ